MISIVIPVKNGAATLEKSLQSIKEQIIEDDFEVLVLDSCSTDKSAAIATKYGARIIHVPAGTFNHGLTRNIGVREASGSLLFFTVQDAWLSEKNQLQRMCDHFQDPGLQAVGGMQGTPHDLDKNPANWFHRVTKPETTYRHFTTGAFSRLDSKEQFRYCPWDDVNAMYRKAALIEVPFVETNFAEDWLWVKDALTQGMKIAYDPSLVVYHYHHRTFGYVFKERYIVNYNFYKHFNVRPKPPSFIKPFAIAVYTLIHRRRKLSIGEKIYWTRHNLSGLLGQYFSCYIFLIVSKAFGETWVNKSFKLFVNEVPMGRSKSSNKNNLKIDNSFG